MPLDPSAKRFLERLAALNPPSTLALAVAARRKGLRDLLSFAGTAVPIAEVQDLTLPGPVGPLHARLYTPVDAPPASPATPSALPGLIYFHGGGLVAGSLDTHDAICRSLANASECRLISVDYRLAPEHRFPAAVEDGRAAVRWISAHAAQLHIDPGRLGICGDSAGATLAAVVCHEVRADRDVHIALQFLLCPVMDYCADTPSRRSFSEGYLLDRATLEHDLRHYLGPDADPADPRISPLRALHLQDVPPTCIHTAECDPLRDEGHAYAQRLEREGIPTIYRCHSGMIHLFYGMGGLLPSATDAYRQMGADIRSMLA